MYSKWHFEHDHIRYHLHRVEKSIRDNKLELEEQLLKTREAQQKKQHYAGLLKNGCHISGNNGLPQVWGWNTTVPMSMYKQHGGPQMMLPCSLLCNGRMEFPTNPRLSILLPDSLSSSKHGDLDATQPVNVKALIKPDLSTSSTGKKVTDKRWP